MLAEKQRTRTAINHADGSTNPRNASDKFALPKGATLRYAVAQQDVPRTAEKAVMSGRRTSKFAGASKPSGGRSEQTDRWTRGDTTSISALLACAVVVVILGAIYLAAYMKVAYQGRQIHNLQVALTAETARQHALINDIGWRESPGRIAEKAKEMGMVMGGKADYVVVHTSTARVTTNSNPATMAVTTPSLGPGTLGDN